MGRGSSVGIVRFPAPVQTDPKAHTTFCAKGTGSFPGVKRPVRSVDHPPPYRAEVKERVELYFYSRGERGNLGPHSASAGLRPDSDMRTWAPFS